MNKRYEKSRKWLIFWTLFIGIGAVGGSLMMFIDPTGKMFKMDEMLPYFQVLPFANALFQNFIFSGVMLLLVNGITNLVASVLLFKRKKIGVILGMTFGVTLMLWITIQFVIFPFNFMSTAYFIFGFLQFLTGYACLVGFLQSKFSFGERLYKNIGKNSKSLVIFFSRSGYTKKLAYEVANEKGAEILEIKTTEKIKGNLGFWWCGRFGMHKWGMPLEKLGVNLEDYEEITLCSPVWVFSLSAPMRQFCKENSNKIKNVNYYITHFINVKFKKIASEMDSLLGVKHREFHSFKCRFGNFKEIS